MFFAKKPSVGSISRLYSIRHLHNRITCGNLNARNVGEKVTIKGWVQRVRILGSLRFAGIRDSVGVSQIVWDEGLSQLDKQMRPESVVEVTGTVQLRPSGIQNSDMKTGEIEVQVEDYKLINEVPEGRLPLTIDQSLCFDEAGAADKVAVTKDVETNFKHRYLALRGAKMQQNLRARSAGIQAARNLLTSKYGFIEVETPYLFKSTPEGANEFLVPTKDGRFYALPQSPQQFKQLLMVGGIDRYFQIAKCFRDEGNRADRQPEFTQLDLELSFPTPQEIMNLTENIIISIINAARNAAISSAQAISVPASSSTIPSWLTKNLPWPLTQEISLPFKQLTFEEALSKYGSDKPDLRIDLEIKDVSNHFCHEVCASKYKALRLNNENLKAVNVSNKSLAALSKDILQHSLRDKDLSSNFVEVAVYKCSGNKIFIEGADPNCFSAFKSKEPDNVQTLKRQICESISGKDDDIIIICHGNKRATCEALGYVRNKFKQQFTPDEKKKSLSFAWITDFPMFEQTKTGLKCAHHPFTKPHPEDDLLFEELGREIEASGTISADTMEQLLSIRSQAFDVVCNGVELGGGSIRIHKSIEQRRVFETFLNISPSNVAKTFQHLLDAFDYGAPPHGGIALGLDRFFSLLMTAENISEVIAFPKTSHGEDLLTGAPSGDGIKGSTNS